MNQPEALMRKDVMAVFSTAKMIQLWLACSCRGLDPEHEGNSGNYQDVRPKFLLPRI